MKLPLVEGQELESGCSATTVRRHNAAIKCWTIRADRLLVTFTMTGKVGLVEDPNSRSPTLPLLSSVEPLIQVQELGNLFFSCF